MDGGGEDARAATGDPDGMAADARSRSDLDGDLSSEPPTPHELVSPRALHTGRRSGPLSLTACSRCLRVLLDETWLPAELVIRELRSFEYAAPPRFEPMLCPTCSSSIAQRRAHARVPLERDLVRSSGRG